jgi:heptosyltransferase-3
VAIKKQSRPKSVLVYQIGSLGDTIVALPAYRAVRRHFGPDAQIYVLHNAPPHGRASPHQVLDGSGLVDGAVTFQQYGGRSIWKTWLEVWIKLRRFRADAVVYIAPGERTPKPIRRDKLFFRICGIRTLLGFHPCNTKLRVVRGPDGRPQPVPREAVMLLERLEKDIASDRAADMRLPLLRLPPEEQDKARAWLHEQRPAGTTFAAVCPGANQPAKFWPMDRFEEIGRRLIAQGIEPLVIGGPVERAMGDRLLAAWGQGINAAGQFSVMGSAALLSRCRFLVGLDTGTTHLAAALGVPCVALYADRDPPGQWEPLGEGHVLLHHAVPCGGCRVTECPVPNHPCMTGLTVEQVWDAINEVNEHIKRTRAPD